MKLTRVPISTLLTLIASAFPLLALLAWQQSELFNSPLEHRIVIIWLELSFIALHLLLPGSIRNISRKTLAAIGIFAIAGLASTINAENVYASLARHSEIILHMLFGIVIYQRATERLAQYILAIGIFSAFVYTLLHLGLLIAVVPKDYNWVMHFPMFSNIRHWSYLLILVMCIIYSQVLTEQTNKYIYLALLLTMFAIFWSGGRASFIPAMILVLGSKLICNIRWKTYLFTVGLTITAGVLAHVLSVENPSLGIARLFFLDRIEALKSLDVNTLSANRIAIYTSSLKEQLTQAPVLGMGADNFRYSFDQDNHGIATQPHSVLVQALYEYGLLGCLILSYLFHLFIRNVRSNNTNKKDSKAKIAVIAALLLAASVDGHFYHSFSLLTICLATSLLLSPDTQQPQKNDRNSKVLISLALAPTALLLVMHTRTFSAYTKPLTDKHQIETVESFPSIILTNNWLDSGNKLLLGEAFKLGIRYSDIQCGHVAMAKFKGIPISDLTLNYCPTKKIRFSN